MREYVSIGPAPYEEQCIQVGDPDYRKRAMTECLHFVKAIRRVCGEPPEGASLGVKSFPHDYGSYLEVVAYYDDTNEKAAEYAFMVEEKAPATWEQAQMVSPFADAGRGR